MVGHRHCYRKGRQVNPICQTWDLETTAALETEARWQVSYTFSERFWRAMAWKNFLLHRYKTVLNRVTLCCTTSNKGHYQACFHSGLSWPVLNLVLFIILTDGPDDETQHNLLNLKMAPTC